jgi:hypothetical protein
MPHWVQAPNAGHTQTHAAGKCRCYGPPAWPVCVCVGGGGVRGEEVVVGGGGGGGGVWEGGEGGWG